MTPQQLLCDGKVMSKGSLPLLHAVLKGRRSQWLLRYDLFSFTMNMKSQIPHLMGSEQNQPVRINKKLKEDSDKFYALRKHTILLYTVCAPFWLTTFLLHLYYFIWLLIFNHSVHVWSIRDVKFDTQHTSN